MCGIYSILNKVNGKIYVGQTYRSFSVRKSEHFYELSTQTHDNYHLQNAWNKYGKDSFEFNVIEPCDLSSLDSNEKWWINYFDSTNRDKGYNMKGGGASIHSHSDETRKKISESLKKLPNPMHDEKIVNMVTEKWCVDRNTTGYYRVTKKIKSDCKQGFYWCYSWRENGKKKSINSVDFDKLKERVIARGLSWCKISDLSEGLSNG